MHVQTPLWYGDVQCSEGLLSLLRGWVEDHTFCVVFVYTTFVL